LGAIEDFLGMPAFHQGERRIQHAAHPYMFAGFGRMLVEMWEVAGNWWWLVRPTWQNDDGCILLRSCVGVGAAVTWVCALPNVLVAMGFMLCLVLVVLVMVAAFVLPAALLPTVLCRGSVLWACGRLIVADEGSSTGGDGRAAGGMPVSSMAAEEVAGGGTRHVTWRAGVGGAGGSGQGASRDAGDGGGARWRWGWARSVVVGEGGAAGEEVAMAQITPPPVAVLDASCRALVRSYW
jgi:hypothetical protein